MLYIFESLFYSEIPSGFLYISQFCCKKKQLCLAFQVFIAQSRSSTRHRDVEDEELTRIFVMIPKTFSEEDLKETFKVTTTISRSDDTTDLTRM